MTDLCQRYGHTIEWADLLRDLDRLRGATIEKDGKRITARTAVPARPAASSRPLTSPLPDNRDERAA